MSQIEAEDSAYCAGFLEADGCIFLGNSCSVRVTNRCLSVLEYFKSLYGGTIRPKSTPEGCFDWVVHGQEAEVFLSNVEPYLRFKRPQVHIWRDFRSTIGVRGKKLTPEIKSLRDSLMTKMKEEKARWRK